MKKTLVAALVTLVAMPSSLALAGEYIHNWGAISHLEDFGDDVYVYGLDLSPNPALCSTPDHARLQPSLSAAKKAGLRRALTAAFGAGRQVKVKLHSTECSGNRPTIYGVSIR